MFRIPFVIGGMLAKAGCAALCKQLRKFTAKEKVSVPKQADLDDWQRELIETTLRAI